MKLLYCSLPGALMFACASAQPTPQLVDARQQYQNARAHQGSPLVLVSLEEAKESLERAEKAHEESPGSYEETSRAYIATRKSELAMAKAGIAYAKATTKQVEQQLVARNASELEETRERLQATSGQLETTAEKLASEQAARQEAEERARTALQSLTDVAMVKEESRGTVITLDGSVLFLTGKSQLLPIAQQRIARVAASLKDVAGSPKLRIEGHTDSQGGQEDNLTLSRERAEGVAELLAQHGIERSRMEVVGVGEARPIASNDTAEGRANNRRVEIIVIPAENESHATAPQTSKDASGAAPRTASASGNSPSQVAPAASSAPAPAASAPATSAP